MMSALRELYQEVILDHNKSPRNFRKMEGTYRMVDGYNPLCGDHYSVYVRVDGDRIGDVSFQGSGCAISKASASMMSTMLKGKTKAEAEVLVDLFNKVVRGEIDAEKHQEELGKLVAFAGVSEFPARVKCASLPWQTAKAAMEEKNETVSTE
ncbi:MAG: Fe-S cluster assembly sulfur transfer protein SufU [Bacteroidota bacterium]